MLRLNGRLWRLIRWSDARHHVRGREFEDTFSRAWLQRLKGDEANITVLRRCLFSEHGAGYFASMSDDEVLGCIEALLKRRVYYVEEHVESSFTTPAAKSTGTAPKVRAAQPEVRSPARQAPQPSVPLRVRERPIAPLTTYWIEIELVDESGEPIPSEPYKVVLPDGMITRGVLSPQGRARIDGIPTPGNCQVSFPQLRNGVWPTRIA